jgi:phage shock protein A
MAQTTILGRIGQLVRANINAMLDGAEDPERMLDQLVRDFTNNIAEAEEAVAQTVGNLRLLEDDLREAQGAQTEGATRLGRPLARPMKCDRPATAPRRAALTSSRRSPSDARSASRTR